MADHIVLIVGRSKSGKNTLADIWTKHYGGVQLEISDTLKQIVQDFFDVSSKILYGSSTDRDTILPKWDEAKRTQIINNVHRHADFWIQELFPSAQAGQALYHLYGHIREILGHSILGGILGEISTRYLCTKLGTDWAFQIDPNVWARRVVSKASEIPGKLAIIPGGRFKHEVNAVLGIRDVPTTIVKIERPSTALLTAQHRSESEVDQIDPTLFDFIIDNSGDLKDLERKALEIGGSLWKS